MDWDDMRVFLAVARNESLSGAARQLRVDPATVGRRIGRLEEQLGMPLFAKSPQGYALTDAGQRLLPHAIQSEQAMEAAKAELVGQTEGLSGQIRIGAPDGSANFLLPQVCAAIGRDNPDLDVQIVALPRVINLSKREADIVVAVSPPTAGRYTVQKITDYHLHFAASDSYLDKIGTLNTLDDLRNKRIIGYIQDMIFDKELDYLGEAGLEHVTLASNSVSVQIQAVRAGAGIGIVHDFSLPFITGVRKVLTDQFSLTRSFYLIRHQDDQRLERMNRFAAALVTELRQEVARLEAKT